MLKVLCCEADLAVTIRPAGPILIKEGISEKSPNEDLKREWQRRFGNKDWKDIPDMIFVRTRRNSRYEPYLPGSSLKGALRSHGERIARTLLYDEGAERFGACDPFDIPGDEEPVRGLTSCGTKLVRRRDGETASKSPEDLDGATIYRAVCPICKLFGCSLLRGRLHVSDAYSSAYAGAQTYTSKDGAVRLAIRDGVGIDRFTGGAKEGAKFDFEVEESAAFGLTLHLENFEVWQLGLLAFILRDMAESLVPIGFGKSRGLGRVSAEVTCATLTYFGDRKPAVGQIAGVGALYTGQADYGFQVGDATPLLGCPPLTSDAYNIRHMLTFSGPTFLALTGTSLGALWTTVAPQWAARIGDWDPGPPMKMAHFNSPPTAAET